MPKTLPGRRRESPIHPSWADYVKHFNPTNPTRSQGAFCRWSGIRSSSLSAAKRKPISDRLELKISEWLEILWIGDGEGLDGSMNTNQHRVAAIKLAQAAESGAKAIEGFSNAVKKLDNE